jgi:hypothetical protein
MTGGSRARVLAVAALVAIAGGAALACSHDCVLPLASSGCAATLDGQVQASTSGMFAYGCPRSGACGSYQVWMSSPGTGSLVCIYDSGGQRLVSATTCTDYTYYCDGTQACLSGGAAVDLGKSCDVFSLPEQACATRD